MKRDIYINALNYYEVKKWAAKEQEADLTYTKGMDKCKEYEATVRDYVAMANDNSQLQTAYQQGTASLDHNSLKKQKFTGRGRKTEATLVQESADLRTSQMEQNARDVDLSVIQPQMDLPSPQVNMWILQDSWTL